MPETKHHPQVSAALADARAGRATLPQLAGACELCARSGPSKELGELREHVRRMVPAPAARAEARGFVLGVVSGLFTHYLISSLSRPSKKR